MSAAKDALKAEVDQLAAASTMVAMAGPPPADIVVVGRLADKVDAHIQKVDAHILKVDAHILTSFSDRFNSTERNGVNLQKLLDDAGVCRNLQQLTEAVRADHDSLQQLTGRVNGDRETLQKTQGEVVLLQERGRQQQQQQQPTLGQPPLQLLQLPQQLREQVQQMREQMQEYVRVQVNQQMVLMIQQSTQRKLLQQQQPPHQ